jgi:hypothetical protein
MVRKTSGLFLSTAENVVIAAVLYTLLAGVMDLVYPTDFSPAMRGAMLSQLLAALLTGVAVTVLCVADSSRFILPPRVPPVDSAASDSDAKDENVQLAEWIRKRQKACLMPQAVAKAYLACSLGIFLFFLACFLQGATGWGLDKGLFPRALRDSNETIFFNASQRLDWVQATSGGAAGPGWADAASQQVQ